jgi:hypothetical protein
VQVGTEIAEAEAEYNADLITQALLRPMHAHSGPIEVRKGFETPFKLKQRILTTPLCPAFDQHRQNNKAILRGLRAKVYSAEPHIKGQICSRMPDWAWDEAE